MLNITLPHSEVISYNEIIEGFFEDCKSTVHKNLPHFYRVVVLSKPEESSLIKSEVWLPKDWNGIFVGTGNGGMGGSIMYDALAVLLRLGYAVANTDLGTSRGVAFGVNNPVIWKDFGWRATYLMTVCAKAIIKKHYGKAPDYAYFLGGSTGGNQALMMAQRFPKEYDGISAGVHANNRTNLHVYMLWNHICAHKLNGNALFSKEDVYSIYDCAVKFHRSLGDGCDGDDFVSFPRFSKEAILNFVNFVSKELPHFTKEQLNALEKIYTGPVNSENGKQIYCGLPIGAEIYHCGLLDAIDDEIPHSFPIRWVLGRDFDYKTFDFNKDLERINTTLSKYVNANSPDLSEFYKNSGKLIAYSGSVDACVPFPDALKYYSRVKKMLGTKITDSFYKYFVFPGREHGENARGTNAIWHTEEGGMILDSLRAWREKGISPDVLFAVGYNNRNKSEGIRFIRPTYPVDSKNASLFSKDVTDAAICDDEYLNM